MYLLNRNLYSNVALDALNNISGICVISHSCAQVFFNGCFKTDVSKGAKKRICERV